MKLRKARVVPIGWELAASRNNANNPATLQEIIDGFDNCTDQGTIGPASASNGDAKWCHLIDPNWILKYPDSQCRAVANGEIRLSSLSPGRSSVCVDMPSCIGENNDGVCTDGYGYCVQEKNAWRFRGDECPAQYASCLAFTNVDTSENAAYLVNTVDYSVCNQENAGCLWYRTNKYFDDAGTTDDETDDTYEWLPTGETYVTAAREDDWQYQDSSGDAQVRAAYPYVSDSGESYSYQTYAYEDRIYLTNNVSECGGSDAGCTRLNKFDNNLTLNTIQNPSFEEDEDSDDFPDQWLSLTAVASSTEGLVEGTPQDGSEALETDASLISQIVSLSPNNFYTLSFYARSNTASGVGGVTIVLSDEDGGSINTAGTSFGGDCTRLLSGGGYQVLTASQVTQSAWTRFDCTFTTPSQTASTAVNIIGNDLLFDAFQLSLVRMRMHLRKVTAEHL